MISSCPNCRQQVSIPRDVDPAALVRCPLCGAEYALSESLALAPPELIPVASAEDREGFSADEEAGRRIGGEEAVAAGERFPAMSLSTRLRPKKQKSGPQVFLEVIAGGLAGCLVAYYALAFYYGPQFHRVGLPKLPLPFISWITAPPADGDKEKTDPAEEGRPASRSFRSSDALGPIFSTVPLMADACIMDRVRR